MATAVWTFLLSGILCICVRGSVISMKSTPSNILPSVTNSMAVTCLLNNTASQQTRPVVGRAVTQTNDDVLFVTSLIITLNENKHIASVTQVTPARALDDQSNAHVSGNITQSNTPGVRAYLQVQWDDPTELHVGRYTCEVNAMDALGHTLVFSANADVTMSPPTLDDMLLVIRDISTTMMAKDIEILALRNKTLKSDQALQQLTSEVKTKNRQLHALQNLSEETNQKILSLKTEKEREIKNLKDQIKSCDDKLTTLETETGRQISALKSEKDQDISAINRNLTGCCSANQNHQHVEAGMINFFDQNDGVAGSKIWPNTDSHGNVYKDRFQSFSKAFRSPPIVHVGIVELRNQQFQTNQPWSVDISVSVVSVTERGFTVRANTMLQRSDNLNSLYRCSASWIAV